MKQIDLKLRALTAFVALGGLLGIAGIFFWVPTEAFQGVVQRIFYVHVPTAWVAYLAFGGVLIGSIAYLKTSKARWDFFAHASAEAGVLFTGLNLVTGMMWGRPIWGTYWTWDARLTSMFVLFLTYAGYLLFRGLSTDVGRGARVAAVIGIAGFIDVPIVHFSVEWWRTLHPAGTVINPAGSPQLPASMLITMLWMMVVFTALFALMVGLRMRLSKAEAALGEAESAGVSAPTRRSPVPSAVATAEV